MTLSKERLEEMTSGDSSRLITVSEALAMARELLERRERDGQEPIGYTYNRGINCEIVAADLNADCPCGIDLYAAPPAPVVVPDTNYQQLSELYHKQVKRLFKIAQRIKGSSFDKYAHSTSQAIDVLESAIFGENNDACRAAMLTLPDKK